MFLRFARRGSARTIVESALGISVLLTYANTQKLFANMKDDRFIHRTAVVIFRFEHFWILFYFIGLTQHQLRIRKAEQFIFTG